MNKWLIVLMVLGVVSLASAEEDRIEIWRNQESVLPLKLQMSTTTIKDIAKFLLEMAGQKQNETYRLYFFCDEYLEDQRNKITLPFVFKQNFIGLINGPHKIEIMLVDSKGRVGRVVQQINVQH